jgi:flavin reductase (DIM6/NTAB) family NADH-FMN oxidoreductase RutF
VVNVVDDSLVAAIQQSSWEYPPEIDEIERLSLTPIPSQQVRPPSLENTKASMECRVVDIRYFSDPPHHSSAVFGEVVHWRVQQGLLEAGRMQFDRLKPLARLAGNQYLARGQIVEAESARTLALGTESVPGENTIRG